MKSTITTGVEVITPAQAKKILENNNGGNRLIRPRRVKQYANALRNDRWHLSGEPIIYSKDGRLLNGQHRLRAVIEADKPMTTVVVRGVEDDAFTVMDSGASRTLGDVFRGAGHKSSNQMAANARMVMQYMAGKQLRDHDYRQALSREEVLEYFEKNQAMFEFAASRGVRLMRVGLNRTTAEAVSFILYQNDYEGADYFIERLLDGAGLRPTSPILAIRNHIIRVASGPRIVDITDFMIPTIISAYNDWAVGNKRQRIVQWKTSDPLPYPVPQSKRVASAK